jgi:hypothetical protein
MMRRPSMQTGEHSSGSRVITCNVKGPKDTVLVLPLALPAGVWTKPRLEAIRSRGVHARHDATSMYAYSASLRPLACCGLPRRPALLRCSLAGLEDRWLGIFQPTFDQLITLR